MIEAARKHGRNGPRDAAAILLAYPHGLRAAELCQLRWSQIDLRQGRLHVNRAKGGIESVHPCTALSCGPCGHYKAYVFVTEAGTPATTAWFLRMVQRTGRAPLRAREPRCGARPIPPVGAPSRPSNRAARRTARKLLTPRPARFPRSRCRSRKSRHRLCRARRLRALWN